MLDVEEGTSGGVDGWQGGLRLLEMRIMESKDRSLAGRRVE